MYSATCHIIPLFSASISFVVCHESKVGLLLKQVANAPVLRTIISMGEVSAEDKKLAAELGIQIYTFSEVEVSRTFLEGGP
jgi:hypothetical protein